MRRTRTLAVHRQVAVNTSGENSSTELHSFRPGEEVGVLGVAFFCVQEGSAK